MKLTVNVLVIKVKTACLTFDVLMDKLTFMGETFGVWEKCITKSAPFFFIGGPCVIENYEHTFKVASVLKELTGNLGIPFVFKASYDKANRTSADSFRGPGLERGLDILARVRDKVGIAVMSDVHKISEVALAARVLDILQIPAFLCRQTDLLLEVAKTGKPVNIKKGQFLAPWDVANVAKKILFAGGSEIMITERGVAFGYNNLVVDFRSISIMQRTGHPIVFDATHSVQLPGSSGNKSGGQREFVPILAKAAVAAGVDGIFMEVHEEPDRAPCDGPNSMRLSLLAGLLKQLKNIGSVVS